jgi:hypothetical protein
MLLFTAVACDDDKSSNNNTNNNNVNNVNNTNNATCGNDTVEGTEVCDGADLAGETCITRGFTGGTLGCAATCLSFVTSGCNNNTNNNTCGDGAVGGAESCDGNDLDGQTCVTQGFASGQLACTVSCTFNTSACENGGGDGLVGDACGNAADCGGVSGPGLTAECVTDPTGMGLFTLPGGYCSSSCTAPTNPGDPDACTAVGGTCINVMVASYCLKPCADASECREPDYGCSAVPGGVETDLYCLPPMGK